MNLKQAVPDAVDDKFYEYTPAAPRVMVPQVRDKSVQQLAAERPSRVAKRQREVDVSSNAVSCRYIRRRLRSKGPAVRG